MSLLKVEIEQQDSSSPDQQRPTCILVVGMHRSGTSALTRVLSLRGADLPLTLMEKTAANKASNPTGHWESDIAATLGDAVLDSAGTDWRSPEPVATSWYRSDRYRDMRDRAVDLLHNEFGTSPLFVFKDPRICKLVPFWLDALSIYGASPKIVSILRNPLEVAASLHARNGFDVSIGQLQWLRYVLDGEVTTRGLPRVFVTYDQLLENPMHVSDRVGAGLDLVWPRQSHKVAADVGQFVSRNHRHHSKEGDQPTGSGSAISELLVDVYSRLRNWATEGIDKDDMVALDRARESFDRAVALLGQPINLALNQSSQIRRFKTADQERQARILEAENQAKVLSEELSRLQIELASQTLDAEGKAKVLDEELPRLRIALATQGREAEGRIKALGEDVSRLHVELAGRTKEAEENARALAEALKAHESARAAYIEISRAFADTSEMLGRIEERCSMAQAELDVCRTRVAQLEADQANFRTSYQDAQIALVRTEERLLGMEEARKEALRSYDQLKVDLAASRQAEGAWISDLRRAELQQARAETRLGILEAELQARQGLANDLDVAKRRMKSLEEDLSRQRIVTGEREEALRKLRSKIEALNNDYATCIAVRESQNKALAEAQANVLALESQLAEQVRIAAQRQDAIEHLRRDRARKVRERDIRNAKLQVKLETLQNQLSSVELATPDVTKWGTLTRRIGRFLRLSGFLAADREAARLEMLRSSPLFDGGWYIGRYEDVRSEQIDPAVHYLAHGGREGRFPSRHFDGEFYLAMNPDVRDAGINPLIHYLEHGHLEGREIRSLAAAKKERQQDCSAAMPQLALQRPSPMPLKPVRKSAPAQAKVAPPPAAPGAESSNKRGQSIWKPRRLSFSTLAQVADLDRRLGLPDAESSSVSMNNPVMVGGIAVASGPSELLADAKTAMVACLWFSALGNFEPRTGRLNPPEAPLEQAIRLQLCDGKLRLSDVWFDTPGEISLRFVSALGAPPLLLRVFQRAEGGQLKECGEMPLAGSGSSLIQCRLPSTFRPLLLAAIDAQGRLVDSIMLPFPSLYRGGFHFGELAVIDDSSSPLKASCTMALRLIERYLASSVSDVRLGLSGITVDASSANGTEAGLTVDLLAWMVHDLGLAVELRDDRENAASAWLRTEFAALSPSSGFRKKAATLRLPATSIPTLSVLFAAEGELACNAHRAIYMHPAENLAAYRMGMSVPADGIDAHSFDPVAKVEGTTGSRSLAEDLSVDLAIVWPRKAAAMAQAFFPAGAATELPSRLGSAEKHRLSVVIDCQSGGNGLIPLLISLATVEDVFEFDCLAIMPTDKADPGLVPRELAASVRTVQSSAPAQITRFANAAQLCAHDRVLLLDESVAFHDHRIVAALWSACETAEVAAASCILVSEMVTAKGTSVLQKSAGWVNVGGFDQARHFAKPDLAGFFLPASFPVVAPEIRCTMMDRHLLTEHGISVADELAMGLALYRQGFSVLCLGYVTASVTSQSFEVSGFDADGAPAGSLLVQSLLQ